MNPRDNDVWAAVGKYSSMALLLPASTLVGYLIGFLLDRLFHTGFLWLVFLLLGIAGGVMELIKELGKEAKNGGQ